MNTKKVVSLVLTVCLLISCVSASLFTVNAVEKDSASTSATTTVESTSAADYGLADNIQDGVILHCWNWSYNNIKNYIPQIAAAGYSAIQTSPVTQPKDYMWKGVAYDSVGIPNGVGGGDNAVWWKSYQPVTMSICDNGQTWYGTKAEFKAMCDEAEKYGVKVIVDIVANHMGNIKGWQIGSVEAVMGDISKQVGEYWMPEMLTDSTYWHISKSWVHSSDGRFDVTQGNMGMPDLNTADKRVQNMVLNLLKECIDNGADGFRFDAAKHIETPEDNASFASDFWPTVLDGAQAYAKQKGIGHDIYYYGEILNRIDEVSPTAYTKRMSVTDNSTSDSIRNSVRYGNAGGAAVSGFCGYVDVPKHAVLWAESHDTYMGGGSSYDSNDTAIKQTWALVGTRKDATALYFARPYYSKDILKDDISGNRQDNSNITQTKMGAVGTLTWCDPSVAAVNKFHNYFIGQSESITSNNNNIVYNERGTTGVVIVKLDGPGAVSVSAKKMQDGTYKDQISGGTFTVSGGKISGTITGAEGIAVVYNAEAQPENTISVKGGTFATETIDVTLGLKNATSGTYQIDSGKAVAYTNDTTITLGQGVAYGTTIKLTLTATDGSNTTTTPYTFVKQKVVETTVTPTTAPSSTQPTTGGEIVVPSGQVILYDNSTTKWTDVYCYIYTSNGNYAAWPGTKMTSIGSNMYSFSVPTGYENGQVLFTNNSGNQIPSANQPGLELGGKSMQYLNGVWQEYVKPTEPVETTAPTTPQTTTSPVTTAPVTTPITTAPVSTDPSTTAQPTTTGDNTAKYLFGDANMDNDVNIKDATIIQKHLASLENISAIGLLLADSTKDSDVSISDATLIQRYIAKYQISTPVGQLVTVYLPTPSIIW